MMKIHHTLPPLPQPALEGTASYPASTYLLGASANASASIEA